MYLLKRLFGYGTEDENPALYKDLPPSASEVTASRLSLFDTTQSTTGLLTMCLGPKVKVNPCKVKVTSHRLIHSFGRQGKGKGQLNSPGGVTVTKDGDIAVVDTCNCRILVFTETGQLKTTISERGQSHHQLNQPMGISIFYHDGEECLIVTDSANACVKAFNMAGICVQVFGDRKLIFEQPHGLAVSHDQHIVVTDLCKHCVVVLDADGKVFSQFGHYGEGPQDLDLPYFVDINNDNRIIVSDSGNMAVKIFTMRGELLYHFTTKDFKIHQEDFVMLYGVSVDGDGNILVIANSTVYIMANDGRFWEVLQLSDGVDSPRALCVSPEGFILVTQESVDLEHCVFVYRYPMEHFRSLRVVPKPRSLTKCEDDFSIKKPNNKDVIQHGAICRTSKEQSCVIGPRRGTEQKNSNQIAVKVDIHKTNVSNNGETMSRNTLVGDKVSTELKQHVKIEATRKPANLPSPAASEEIPASYKDNLDSAKPDFVTKSPDIVSPKRTKLHETTLISERQEQYTELSVLEYRLLRKKRNIRSSRRPTPANIFGFKQIEYI